MTKYLISTFILIFSLQSFSHGGGTDSFGCHHNRKASGYHCHKGPYHGKRFKSEGDAMKYIMEHPKAFEPKKKFEKTAQGSEK